MNSSLKNLVTFLVFLAAAFYMGSIIAAGIISYNGGRTIDPILSFATSVIGGVLATNLGAVLGITVTRHRKLLTASDPAKFLGLMPTFQKDHANHQQISSNQKLQIIACYFYIISLALALVFYYIAIVTNDHHPEPLPVLADLSKTLIGVLAGALILALGK